MKEREKKRERNSLRDVDRKRNVRKGGVRQELTKCR